MNKEKKPAPFGYCTECGNPLVRERRHGCYDKHTGEPRYYDVEHCSNIVCRILHGVLGL